MAVKNRNQIKKDLVKRMRILKEQRKAAVKEIDNLPEIEKLEYDISMLDMYIKRYKNDLSNLIILNKVNLYKKQREEKLERLTKLKDVNNGQTA